MTQLGEDPDLPPNGRQRVLTVLGAVAAGISGAIATWLFTLSLREVEVVGALLMLLCGLTLDVRWVIHLKLGYLSWRGTRGHLWGDRERGLLSRLTVIDGGLGLALSAVGFYFFRNPGGLLQLGALVVLMMLVYVVIEATRRVIQGPGGPPPGSDVIENCRPVRYVLNPERIWNGKWGLDTIFWLVAEKAPVGHRNKAAVLLIFVLALSTATQVVALVGRTATDGHQAKVAGRRGESHRLAESDHTTTPEVEPISDGERTYEENCGTEVAPGDGIPEPLSRQQQIIWEELSPADGCAMRARRIADGSTYLTTGQCQGVFWSLGIASGDAAAVLIEDAAVAARRISQSQELLGASQRHDIDAGDFHLVYTPAGPFLLIREQKTDGNGGPKSRPESCTEIKPGKERYTVVPPGMAELWLRFNEEGIVPSWPFTDAGSLSNGRRYFTFRGPAQSKLAWGSCVSPIECEVESDRGRMVSTANGVRSVTVKRILELSPGR